MYYHNQLPVQPTHNRRVKMKEQLIENLTQAAQEMSFVVGDLQSANKKSSAVEHLLIIKMIEDAVDLNNRIGQLLNALEFDKKESDK